MTGSATLDFLLGAVVLAAGGWIAWRGPIRVLRVIAAVVVVFLALVACGTIRLGVTPVPA